MGTNTSFSFSLDTKGINAKLLLLGIPVSGLLPNSGRPGQGLQFQAHQHLFLLLLGHQGDQCEITPPWYPSVWPFAKLWPTRARPSISSSLTPLSPSPWTPRGSMRNPLWIRRGSALLPRGGMQEGERSF